MSNRGFTLVEMLVASAVAGVAVAAAFTFATYQVRGYSEQQDTQDLTSSSRSIAETIIEDVRSAGLSTSFYAGVPNTVAFGGRAVITDGTGPLGIAAVWILDQITSPTTAPADGLGVMLRSDSITILRVEGEPTFLPSSGAGNTGIPPPPAMGLGPYTVVNQAALRPCATGPNASYLALISDMVRQGEPASILVELDVATGWGAVAADGSGPIRFASGNYGINPAAVPTANGVLPAGRVFGPGSLVTCVRVVTYWLDNLGRVRMFEGSRANIADGATVNLGGGGTAWPAAFAMPIRPVDDAVVAESVRDLQFEAYMSSKSPFRAANWALNTIPLAASRPAAGTELAMVETRAIRVNALLATPRAGNARIRDVPDRISNHDLTLEPAANYPNTHSYRLVTHAGELRNMRHFDLMSSFDRDWNEVRSYPQ